MLTTAIPTVGTVIDESRQETAKGVARLPNRFSSSDRHPCYYHRLEYDIIVLSIFLLVFFLVSPFGSFPLPAVLRPVPSSPSCCFVCTAAICPS